MIVVGPCHPSNHARDYMWNHHALQQLLNLYICQAISGCFSTRRNPLECDLVASMPIIFFPNRWTQGMSALLKKLSKYFKSKATFWVCRLRAPRPPSLCVKKTLSYAALGGFLAFTFPPLQRLCFLYLSTCLITILCMREVQRKNIGRDVNTAVVISNLPAWDRKVDVLRRRCSHLVIIGKKSSTLGFVNPRGNPKYVKGREPTRHPNACARALVLCFEMLIGPSKELE